MLIDLLESCKAIGLCPMGKAFLFKIKKMSHTFDRKVSSVLIKKTGRCTTF